MLMLGCVQIVAVAAGGDCGVGDLETRVVKAGPGARVDSEVL